jgi:hypothetical protein
MIPTRLNTSALPDTFVLIITGIALASMALIVVWAVVMDRVDKAKGPRSKK